MTFFSCCCFAWVFFLLNSSSVKLTFQWSPPKFLIPLQRRNPWINTSKSTMLHCVFTIQYLVNFVLQVVKYNWKHHMIFGPKYHHSEKSMAVCRLSYVHKSLDWLLLGCAIILFEIATIFEIAQLLCMERLHLCIWRTCTSAIAIGFRSEGAWASNG